MKYTLLKIIMVFGIIGATVGGEASYRDADVSQLQAEISQTVQDVLRALENEGIAEVTGAGAGTSASSGANTSASAGGAANLELASMGDDDWSFKRFLLRLQLKMGIEVPIFVKFEIIPEVEMVFLKEN